MSKEQLLQTRLLTTYAPALPRVRLFRRNIFFGETARGARMRAGIKGQADVYGYCLHAPCAVPFELELKAARGVLADDQKRWQSFCAAWRVPHLVLRAERLESEEETVTRWIEEIRTMLAGLGATA